MEAVNIFAIVDSHDDLLLIDVLGERQLHDEAVDIAVAVQAIHTLEQLVFGHIVLVAYECRLEATLLTCYDFVFDVCL